MTGAWDGTISYIRIRRRRFQYFEECAVGPLMIAGKSDEAESAALRFSLAALFVVMTAVAALFASAGLKAIFCCRCWSRPVF